MTRDRPRRRVRTSRGWLGRSWTVCQQAWRGYASKTSGLRARKVYIYWYSITAKMRDAQTRVDGVHTGLAHTDAKHHPWPPAQESLALAIAGSALDVDGHLDLQPALNWRDAHMRWSALGPGVRAQVVHVQHIDAGVCALQSIGGIVVNQN